MAGLLAAGASVPAWYAYRKALTVYVGLSERTLALAITEAIWTIGFGLCLLGVLLFGTIAIGLVALMVQELIQAYRGGQTP